jgi:hypothetical protein
LEKKMIRSVTAAALLAALVTPALAENTQFGEAGAWAILKDGDRFDNCFAEAQFSDGVLLRMGLLDDAKKSFVGVFNSAWTQFEEGSTYPVAVAVDGKAFEAELIESVSGRKVGDLHGAEVTLKDPGLLEAVAAGKSLTFMSDGAEMVTVGLDGSAAALEQVVACQATR